MAELTLTAQPRELVGKGVARLRGQGLLPAVVYGPALEGPHSIMLDYKAFEAVYRAVGKSSLVELNIGEGGPRRPVFIRDVQYNLLRRRIDHVDFYAANLREETTVSVPVVLIGTAPVAERGDAVVSQLVHALQVRALPTAIPQRIEVDISGIESLADDVRLEAIALPDSVSVLEAPETVIVSVTRSAAAEAAVEDAAEAAEAAEAAAEAAPAEAEAAADEEENT